MLQLLQKTRAERPESTKSVLEVGRAGHCSAKLAENAAEVHGVAKIKRARKCAGIKGIRVGVAVEHSIWSERLI
jgi:hypothetical protein